MSDQDSFIGTDGRPYLGFSYAVGSEGVEPSTPDWTGPVKDAAEPSVDRLVRATQAFLSVGVDPDKIGPPEEALTPEQHEWLRDDERYRQDLVVVSGGEVSVFEGVVVSEAEDPSVRYWVDDFELRQRGHTALAALRAYDGSWEIRAAHWAYQRRLFAQDALRRFWVWLRKVETTP